MRGSGVERTQPHSLVGENNKRDAQEMRPNSTISMRPNSTISKIRFAAILPRLCGRRTTIPRMPRSPTN